MCAVVVVAVLVAGGMVDNIGGPKCRWVKSATTIMDTDTRMMQSAEPQSESDASSSEDDREKEALALLATIPFERLASVQTPAQPNDTSATFGEKEDTKQIRKEEALALQSQLRPHREIQHKKKSKSRSAPVEMSSKGRPPKRVIIENNGKRRVAPRDPRFTDLVEGHCSVMKTQNYGFIDDYRQTEKKDLVAQLKATLDEEEKGRIRTVLRSMKSREEAKEQKARSREVVRQRVDEDNKRMEEHGGNPYYMSDKKKRSIVMEDRYTNMNESRLNTILNRKRKKQLGKEKKLLPPK